MFSKVVLTLFFNFSVKYIIIIYLTTIKKLKNFDPKTWCTKNPVDYRIIHHGYSLTYCPGHIQQSITQHLKLTRNHCFLIIIFGTCYAYSYNLVNCTNIN